MKLFGIIFTLVVIGIVLGIGIDHADKGHYWLLACAGIAYLLLFARLGCIPPKNSH
jgi:hypothetical protein